VRAAGALPKEDDRERSGSGGVCPPEPPPALSSLSSAHPLRWSEVALGRRRLGLFTLADPDALLDALTQEEFDRSDARMPYWACLWPAAKALAEEVLEGPGLAGRRVLDLGCGLGLVGLAALERGAHVTFLDWEPAAVLLARHSAYAAGHARVSGVAADWRAPPPLAPFDRILAADVLYEERNAPGVAAFLAAHLAPGGTALVSDPGRRHAAGFAQELTRVGLAVRGERALGAHDEASAVTRLEVERA
jgi:predicted nicotinamide N-methyase